MAGITQSLAGRVATLNLLPFSLAELENHGLKVSTFAEVIFSGLYPPIYDREVDSRTWYANYIRTYIERDVRQISAIHDLHQFQIFLQLCAGRISNILDVASLASDAGISQNTAKNWLAILEASFIIYRLYPHYKNFSKRLVKRPKLYFYDTGLACRLLGMQSVSDVQVHSMRGHLFECLIINEFYKHNFNHACNLGFYFWRNHKGVEIDLVFEQNDTLQALEIKSGATIASDFFKNLLAYKEYAGPEVENMYLIYGGNQTGTRHDVSILPWYKASSIL